MTPPLHVMRPDTAGIDIGATEMYVAVPADRDPEPVRCFGTFTEDLHAIAKWLKSCRITTVAMESTGVYWIALYLILEPYGIDVHLVTARHVKNVPGRKTDVSDCQWLQYLHPVGLLRKSFRPADEICVARSLLRHWGDMVRSAAAHKLARIIYHLVTTHQAYDESASSHEEVKRKQRMERKLKSLAAELGYQLAPAQVAT